jgi:hypothetical protein
MRSKPNLAVRALAVLALLACAARADVVHYKDGRTLEGTITKRTATEITVKTDFGTIVVPLSKVAKIEERKTAAQELEARRAALPAGDAAALFELAVWARDAELVAESRALFREVITLTPDHALANEALGRVQLDDRWLDPGEVAAYVKEHEAEKREAGLLWDDGRWRPEAEVMERRGFVRVHEDWVARRPGETTLLLEDLAALGIPLTATSGVHVTLLSALTADEAERLASNLDDVVKDLLLRWKPTEAELASLTAFDIPVLALPDLEAVGVLMDSEVLERYGAGAGFRARFRQARGFSHYTPRPLIGLVAHGEHLDVTGDEDLARLGVATHQLAHVLVQRFKCGARAPGWVEAGLAAFYEGAVTQHATLTITSFARDAQNQPLDPFVHNWEDFGHWNENLAKPALAAQAGDLRSLMSQGVEELDSREIGASWSVLRFLMERHPDELLAYVRAWDTGKEAGKDPPVLHAAAWRDSFSLDLADVEFAWRAWAEAQPTILLPPRLLSRPL